MILLYNDYEVYYLFYHKKTNVIKIIENYFSNYAFSKSAALLMEYDVFSDCLKSNRP